MTATVTKPTTIIAGLRGALEHEMEHDERVFVMGEDVGIGGSFHLTLGLSDRFGAERIRDTPVAEAGFVGLAIGAAMAGMRPVVDFQYGDFLLPAADQIVQQACKLHYMSGGQVDVPVVLHAPTGASGRGAQHANSIENFFYGVPGLTVAVPSTAYDAKGAMTTAIRSQQPTLILSHKHLYGSKGRHLVEGLGVVSGVPEEPYEIEVGRAAVRREGADITIVGSLLMVHRALDAAERLAASDIDADVIDLRWLAPLDTETVKASVGKTGRLLVVQEGPALGGWGSDVVAAIASDRFADLRAPARCLAGYDKPLPFAPHLESELVPSVDGIVAAATELTGWVA